jgi:hypothetical protein
VKSGFTVSPIAAAGELGVQRGGLMTGKHRIFTTSFASVYPLYVAKAEKKGRTKSEVDAIILWLTGYSQKELERQLK